MFRLLILTTSTTPRVAMWGLVRMIHRRVHIKGNVNKEGPMILPLLFIRVDSKLTVPSGVN